MITKLLLKLQEKLRQGCNYGISKYKSMLIVTDIWTYVYICVNKYCEIYSRSHKFEIAYWNANSCANTFERFLGPLLSKVPKWKRTPVIRPMSGKYVAVDLNVPVWIQLNNHNFLTNLLQQSRFSMPWMRVRRNNSEEQWWELNEVNLFTCIFLPS